jgi:hypothetical protein
MDLKDFHVIFIVCSILISAGFGVWALHNYGQPPTLALKVTAVASYAVAIALTVYCVAFIKKLKTNS